MKQYLLYIMFIVLVGCGTTPDFSPLSEPDQKVIQTLTIGPMIGNITDKSIRLWGRGTKDAIGVVQIREQGEKKWLPAVDFEFDSSLDYTGTIELPSLNNNLKIKADTAYEYRMGYIHKSYKGKVKKLAWDKSINPATLHTFPKTGSAKKTRFILGSCRDQTVWSSKGEDTFSHIDKLLEHEKTNGLSSQFILQMGDQVYVDLDGIAFLSKGHTDINRLWKTYRKSFSWPNFRSVMSKLPSYMILDDHEIQNDWTKGRYDNNEDPEDEKYDKKTLEIGMTAYLAYQGSLNLNKEDKKQEYKKEKYENWYQFSHAKADFFVLDTRSENTMHVALSEINDKKDPKIISDKQMYKLKEWLKPSIKNNARDKDNEHIKFIVSPVPLFPDVKHVNSIGAPLDKWAAGVWQRHELLEFIRKNKIKKVVFLSGDVHASSIAELTHTNDRTFKIYNVMASSFNWSTSAGLGLQEENFDFFKKKKVSLKACARGKYPKHENFETCSEAGKHSQNPSKNYKVRRYSNSPKTPLIHKKNNFSRITTHGTDSVTVEFFSGHNGKLLESTEIRF